MRYCITLSFLLLFFGIAYSQQYKVYGKIVNRNLEPLAFASVEVKEFKQGAVTKEDGTYELRLEEGKYDLVVSMIGYKSQLVTVIVTKNTEKNFLLDPDNAAELGEVTVKGKIKDHAEEIIRNVIRNKEAIMAAAGDYSCNVYIKAVQEDSLVGKNRTKKIDTTHLSSLDKELSKMAMAEITLHVDRGSGQQLKEERTGVSKRGDVGSLFYLSATEGDFSLYNNLVKMPSVAEIPFISPISYSGLMAYRFKTTKIEWLGKQKIYTINIRPRQVSNATVEGEVTIADSSWVILHSVFSLPSYHLPEYDFFEIEQQYSLVHDTAWMITRQHFTYSSKYGKGKRSGQTLVMYKDF
ncbi:MAG: carboxypeptidase-like regulatory domain-containing protein, partial [Bacteroidetes bacterium]|nr:carboxypeptidase-like regulatory domain-containing protein [Bacteroidota bacterium]